jgi:hypothetical protein
MNWIKVNQEERGDLPLNKKVILKFQTHEDKGYFYKKGSCYMFKPENGLPSNLGWVQGYSLLK